MAEFSGNTFNKVVTSGTDAIVYTDTLWDDLRIVPGAFQFVGTGDPTLVDWTPSGSGVTFKAYEFNNADRAFFMMQVPHNYKLGTDLKPHIHWTPGTRGNEENGNTVAWKMDYSIANIGAAFPTSGTVDLTDTCSGTDHLHEITPSGTITGTAITSVSTMLMCRIYRDTGDTWATNTTGNRPLLLEIDFHYEIDSPGSRQEVSK